MSIWKSKIKVKNVNKKRSYTSMNNPSTIIKSITEKLEFLNGMEKFYQKVQEMLHYLGIKSPSKPDFNYYSELIKVRIHNS